MKEPQTAISDALKQEFQQDLELFKHLLLLVNDSGPIRNIELMWHAELDPTKQRFKDRVGTEDALVQLQPATGAANRKSPSTLFCDLVHGFGAHEEQTCAHSDEPAKERCRTTGCAQVYACHVGLVDIAVPVICEGQYLGTLFSGQVVTKTPTPDGFDFVRRALGGQTHIDFTALEAAYYRVPVVEPQRLAETVRILELFARYIANSWRRLLTMAEAQRTKDRQLALERKEVAAMLLSGEVADGAEAEPFIRRAGLKHLPERVLVLQLYRPDPARSSRSEITGQMNLNRLTHLMEDFCQSWPNVLATVVNPGELCIFTGREVRNANHERISVEEMARSIVDYALSHGIQSARIGISKRHRYIWGLTGAYQEACAALESGGEGISVFIQAATSSGPAQMIEPLVKAIREGGPVAAHIRAFVACAMPDGDTGLQASRWQAVLTWAIEHVGLEMVSTGADSNQVLDAKQRALNGVLNAPTPFIAGEAFRRFAETAQEHMASLFSHRDQKIARAVCRFIDESGPAQVTVHDIARALQLSSGHLNRIIRRTTGTTLEELLIRRRVDLAKRLLLDTRLNVAQVAERCGFCNSAYFASVFRKYVQRTPSEFARSPQPKAENSRLERAPAVRAETPVTSTKKAVDRERSQTFEHDELLTSIQTVRRTVP